MNKILLLSLFCLLVNGLMAQSIENRASKKKWVVKVKYTTLEKQHVIALDDIDQESMIVLDKLKFVPKKYQNRHTIYFNENNQYEEEIKFISHENKFPKWFSHPLRTVHNEQGIQQFFLPNRGYRNASNREYRKSLNGNLVKSFDYEGFAAEDYTALDKQISKKGLLDNLTFKMPTAEMIEELEREGFEIKETVDEIFAETEKYKLRWNARKKQTSMHVYEHERPILKEYVKYTYNAKVGENLIHKITLVHYDNFSNGQKYKEIVEREYSDYEIRRADENVEDETLDALVISPNPIYDVMHVSNMTEEGTLMVYSVTGALLLQRKVDSPTMSINLKDLETGQYIVTYTSQNYNLNSKIIKL